MPDTGDPGRGLQADLAQLAAVIERHAGDLGLAEEPARFVAALDDGAPPDEAPEAR